MSRYVVFNVTLAVVTSIICAILGRAGRFRRWAGTSARAATLVTALGFPWDFFAGYLHAWNYPRDPGMRLYGVPINDLIFMWICTYLACNILLFADERNGSRD